MQRNSNANRRASSGTHRDDDKKSKSRGFGRKGKLTIFVLLLTMITLLVGFKWNKITYSNDDYESGEQHSLCEYFGRKPSEVKEAILTYQNGSYYYLNNTVKSVLRANKKWYHAHIFQNRKK